MYIINYICKIGPWKNPTKHAFGQNWLSKPTNGIGFDLAPASRSVNPSNANVNVVSGININGTKRKSPKGSTDRRKRPDTSGKYLCTYLLGVKLDDPFDIAKRVYIWMIFFENLSSIQNSFDVSYTIVKLHHLYQVCSIYTRTTSHKI